MKRYIIAECDIDRIKAGTMNIDSIKGDSDYLCLDGTTMGDVIDRLELDLLDDNTQKLLDFVYNRYMGSFDVTDIWQFIEDTAILFNEGR